MKVLSVILGVILTAFGICLFFSPFRSFLSIGVLLAIAFLVYGVFGIIDAIVQKHFSVVTVLAIVSLLLGIFMLVFPHLMIIADGVLVYIAAAYMIVFGAVKIYSSIQAKPVTPHTWGWGLALGIIAVFVGIYGFINPLVTALALGFIVGFNFISIGLNMITFVAVEGKMEDEMHLKDKANMQ